MSLPEFYHQKQLPAASGNEANESGDTKPNQLWTLKSTQLTERC